ncbi:MAG: DNA alkylation repair protein [Marinilabiliaceae bacterium]|nr:DNA alkylation repair protein [Marinilabiliaceae bacterium]
MNANINSSNTDDCNFDSKLRELKFIFHSRMNGEASMQMKRLNAVYKINYGVSLPHLKEIAHEVIFSPEECDKLWTTNIREAMLVACIQLPDAEATVEKMLRWSADVATADMAELASFLLFYRTHELTAFCEALVKRNNPYDFTIAVHSAARALQHSLPALDAANVICDAIVQRTEFSLSEVRGIAMLINRLNIDSQTAPLAKKVVDYLTNINTDDAQKILFSVE